jgi:hypothetical protein
MSNKKAKRKRKEQRQQQQHLKQSQRQFQIKSLWQAISKGYRGLVVTSVFLSLFGFAFLVYPRLSIGPGATIMKSNPFYTPFILKNDGYLPVSDLQFVCFMKSATLAGSAKPNITNIGIQLAKTEVAKLGANKSASIDFARIFNKEASFSSAQIDVVVTYRPFLIPFKRSEIQTFKTKENYNGELIWSPVAE